MLHVADAVAVALRLHALRHLEEREQRVAAGVEEVMAQVLERRVAAVAGTGAEARRNFQRVDQRHAEHADIEVERHLHVVGVQGEVVDAAGQRPCVVHRRMLAVIMPVMQVGIVWMAMGQAAMRVRMGMRFAPVPGEGVAVLVVLVVRVRVRMLHRLVDMSVLVALGQVQPYPERHQGGGDPECARGAIRAAPAGRGTAPKKVRLEK